jgi:PleD family two-component response regulator
MPWNGASFQVQTSIGVVHIDAAYKDVASVIAAADAACYAAKRSGRNAVRSGSVLRLV